MAKAKDAADQSDGQEGSGDQTQQQGGATTETAAASAAGAADGAPAETVQAQSVETTQPAAEKPSFLEEMLAQAKAAEQRGEVVTAAAIQNLHSKFVDILAHIKTVDATEGTFLHGVVTDLKKWL